MRFNFPGCISATSALLRPLISDVSAFSFKTKEAWRSSVAAAGVSCGPPSLQVNFFRRRLTAALRRGASFCRRERRDKWKIEQWRHKSSRWGLVLQQENALKTMCVCTYSEAFCISLVESLCCCSFFFFLLFHSSTVRSYCQLADSCFIILFQNLNPKTWKRERETSAYYYTRASLASAPRSPGRKKTSGGSLGIARWSKGMKMTCYLHCFGTVVLDEGVAKYLERWGLENMSKCCRVSWTINSFFPLLYRFVSQAYVLCSGQVSVNNLTTRSRWPPRKIINVGSKKKESENCLTTLSLKSQKVSYIN